MKTVIKYIRLPFEFSPESLLKEINAVTGEWLAHYNSGGYEGEWKALPLRTMGGSLTSHMAEGNTPFQDTVLMVQCPGIKSIVDSFHCEKESVRILNLRPGAVIKEHRDRGLSYEDGAARIHIVLQTNPSVLFYVDGENMALEPGSCWYMNFDLPHRLENNGVADRLHLVMDCVVNDWLRELFENCASEHVSRIAAKEQMTAEQKRMMLEYLKEMNTPTSLELAQKLETELANVE
jgi:hypothetical protein